MKNVIRAFVFALTITGTAAYTTTSSSTVTVASSKPSLFPIPVCPPDDPHACGIAR